MKTTMLTLKMERQRNMMLVLPLIAIPFLMLLFWALGCVCYLCSHTYALLWQQLSLY
jgi:membrane protein insertase Oxa1/YidC/SpoIIIJ